MERMRVEVELIGPLRIAELRREALRERRVMSAVPAQERGPAVVARLRQRLAGECRRWPLIDRNRPLRPNCPGEATGSLGQSPL